jgi:hypothetical protein
LRRERIELSFPPVDFSSQMFGEEATEVFAEINEDKFSYRRISSMSAPVFRSTMNSLVIAALSPCADAEEE